LPFAGLSSERARWTNDIKQLGESKVKLDGDCLLSSAFLSYLGAFNFDFRERLVQDVWMKDIKEKAIPLTEPYSLQAMLTNDVEISKWASEGLPSDELSVQNGILTTRASRSVSSALCACMLFIYVIFLYATASACEFHLDESRL
jgi:dynein heavy chain